MGDSSGGTLCPASFLLICTSTSKGVHRTVRQGGHLDPAIQYLNSDTGFLGRPFPNMVACNSRHVLALWALLMLGATMLAAEGRAVLQVGMT